MPKALNTKAGALLDSWGRSNNRKLLAIDNEVQE